MQAVCFVAMVMVAMALGDDLHTTNFRNWLLNDVIFTENLLFETQARSRLVCSGRCASTRGCLTFTFTKGSRACRGHAALVNPNTSVTPMPGTKAYTGCASDMYTVLEDNWRDKDKNTVYHCDRDTLPAGWSRFRLYGADAVIPTTCVKQNHCGTNVAIWLDLQGHALPGVGQELQVQLCGGYTGGCCAWSDASRPATVRNCGTFYIYKLQPPPFCSAAYCTTAK